MITGLTHIHSSLRYVILALLIYTAIKAWMGWLGKKDFQPADRKAGAMTMGLLHLQLIIGLALYIMKEYFNVFSLMKQLKESGQDASVVRFWGLEHISMMIVGIILVTLGHMLSKRALTNEDKYKKLAIFFTLGLLIIFAAIPWPFIKTWGSWF
jgi:hypothetical protein